MQQQVARIVETKPNPTAAIVALRTVFIFFFLFSLVKKRIDNVFTWQPAKRKWSVDDGYLFINVVVVVAVNSENYRRRRKKKALSPDCWVIELVDDWQWLMSVMCVLCINVGQTRSRKKRRSRQSHIPFFSSKNFSIVFTLDAHSSPTMAVKRERKHSWENLSSRNRQHTKSEGNNKETGDIFTNRKKNKNSSPLLWPGVYISVRKL